MPSSSPVPVYVIGAGCVFLSIHYFLRPEKYASPVLHLKGIRETTYGLVLGALQYHGYDDAVTIMKAVMSLAGLGDGIVVWIHGGNEARWKAFGHWGAFAALAGWSLWRTYGGVHG
ncbi:hypothetical protein F4814DRAFT_441680 [Daldinia grandis]|nr:hypothetical protein F4814DRAFT_441680 [Daldinia grandis]